VVSLNLAHPVVLVLHDNTAINKVKVQWKILHVAGLRRLSANNFWLRILQELLNSAIIYQNDNKIGAQIFPTHSV